MKTAPTSGDNPLVMHNRIPSPRRLNPRVWLISTPLSILSLERRARLPKLPTGRWRFLGLPLLVASVGLWGWSARTLMTKGAGTPDPDNPPLLLVEDGPYQYTRNPMMLAALTALFGTAVLQRSLLLLLYLLGLAAIIQRYLVRVEEPELKERFGVPYREYTRRVPRWLPRLGRNAQREPAPVPEED
ncbi:MAG: methyltransferase family protein [Dehalococcoidia bacterium]